VSGVAVAQVIDWNDVESLGQAGPPTFSLDVFPRPIGFVVSICRVPLFGFEVKLSESFAITLIFMVISIIRSYLVRRFFALYVKRFAAWCGRIVALIPEY
jgi:hypothetical protein